MSRWKYMIATLAMIFALAFFSVMPTAAKNGAPSDTSIRLQALTATSGENVEKLLDNKNFEGWRPTGDPVNEGILFRFEEPISVDKITVVPCEGYENRFTGVGYFNSSEHFPKQENKSLIFSNPNWKNSKLKSFFFRITQSTADVCLFGVVFDHENKPLDIKPPLSVPGTVTVSSTLDPAEAYHKSYLFDKRLDFGWVEGAKGLGIGESIQVIFSEPQRIEGFEIWNGYQRSNDHFRKNARVKKLQIRVEGYPPQELSLKDTMQPQSLRLAEPITGKKVTLKILEAYKGSKYEDLVISELRFIGPNGPFSLRTEDQLQMRTTLLAKVKGTVLQPLVDKQLISVCSFMRDAEQDKPGRRVKLRSNHTFVSYEQKGTGEASYRNEVFDGIWIIQGTSSKSATIEFFGRRSGVLKKMAQYTNLTAKYFEETGQNLGKESTVVAGGKAEIKTIQDICFSEYKKIALRIGSGLSHPLGGGCLVCNEYESCPSVKAFTNDQIEKIYNQGNLPEIERERQKELGRMGAFFIVGRGMVDVLYPVSRK